MPRHSSTVVDVAGPWSHRAVSANGARFHVADMGTGPLVLLLHGFPEYWWTWRAQLPALAAAGYRAAAMDLRGYGGSDKPPRGYDPFTLSADIAGVVRSLGHTDAVLVGHGWGAYLAWAAAVMRPKVVRGLVAVSMGHPLRMRSPSVMLHPTQLTGIGQVLSFQRPWAPERALVADDAALVEALLRRWAAPGWPDAATSARYRAAMQIPQVAHSALEFYRWVFRSVPRPDGLRFAARMRAPVEAPTLHVHGGRDGALRPRTAQGSGRYVAGDYRWRLLEDAGHFPQEEVPEQFTAELLQWLTERSGGEASRR